MHRRRALAVAGTGVLASAVAAAPGGATSRAAAVNGLTDALLADDPNSANPHRLSRSQAVTCDQDHDDTPEQAAVDHVAVDRFVEATSDTTGTPEHRRPFILTRASTIGAVPSADLNQPPASG